jgi:hypothetical protein
MLSCFAGGQTKIKMKLETQLFDECISRNYNCSITYQRINDYSVEVYRGYQSNYEKIFYTDGHIDKEKAIRKALKFLRAMAA